jgi:hypothetical protein
MLARRAWKSVYELQVVRFGVGEADVAGGEEHTAVREFELLQQRLGVTR